MAGLFWVSKKLKKSRHSDLELASYSKVIDGDELAEQEREREQQRFSIDNEDEGELK